MANWNKMTGEKIKLIQMLHELGNEDHEIVKVTGTSFSTVHRVLSGQYDENGTYIGPKGAAASRKEQPQETKADIDLEWLKDVMVKVLYESCQTNNLLKALLEKWK